MSERRRAVQRWTIFGVTKLSHIVSEAVGDKGRYPCEWPAGTTCLAVNASRSILLARAHRRVMRDLPASKKMRGGTASVDRDRRCDEEGC